METASFICFWSAHCIASFIGSGINGNIAVEVPVPDSERIASFIGSGINGNLPIC